MIRKKMFRFAVTAAAAVGVLAGGASGQQSETGLKDVYARYFRIGTAYQWREGNINNTNYRNRLLQDFNSVTHEDDLKPINTMVKNGSSDDDIKVELNDGAKAVFAFCEANNIPVRGHAFVWHQQTPNWFFLSDFNNNNSKATPEQMNSRIESYAKNMFTAIKSQYPNLNLYAYDVVNEAFLDNGQPRNAQQVSGNSEGSDNSDSKWVEIYGGASFIEEAFKAVKAARDAVYGEGNGPKLFYNDFNEYHPAPEGSPIGKVHAITEMATELYGKGLLEGIGMQSHLAISWPDMATYKAAIDMFAAIGCEIHVTELDITVSAWNEDKPSSYTPYIDTHAQKYADVFSALIDAKENGANITSVSLWGITDEASWRGGTGNTSDFPLLFTQSGQSITKKKAYDVVFSLIDESKWGNGLDPEMDIGGGDGPAYDENGYYFYHSFENGMTQSWGGRSNTNDCVVSVVNTETQHNSGSKSLHISNRCAAWNGALFALPGAFKAGETYSFSVMVRSPTAGEISLGFQYQNSANEESYDNIAKANVQANEWVQISNVSYKFPANSSAFAIYVEHSVENAEIYIDDAMGGIKDAAINEDGTPIKLSISSVRAKQSLRVNPLVSVRGRTLFVGGTQDQKVRVRVVNMKGKTVAKHSVKGGASVTLRKLPAGVYMVEAVRAKDKFRDSTRVTLK